MKSTKQSLAHSCHVLKFAMWEQRQVRREMTFRALAFRGTIFYLMSIISGLRKAMKTVAASCELDSSLSP